MKIKQTCDRCGSEDVGVDAWAVWDVENQRWEVSTTYDSAWCNACDAETHIRIEEEER